MAGCTNCASDAALEEQKFSPNLKMSTLTANEEGDSAVSALHYKS